MMEPHVLMARIEAETGLVISKPEDQYLLSGIFNRYRPDGAGLASVLSDDGIEGEVRARIKQIFEATASSWTFGDLYFVIKHFDPLDQASAIKIARDYLQGMKRLANLVGDAEAVDTISALSLVSYSPTDLMRNSDASTMMYECLTDFLSGLQPDRHEIFMLKEALYSMANDYFLMAYMLWPAIQLRGEENDILNSYFDMWRYGIKLEFFANGIVSVSVPS